MNWENVDARDPHVAWNGGSLTCKIKSKVINATCYCERICL